MIYKKILALSFLVYSLQAMQSESGQMQPRDDQETNLNKASQDLWNILDQSRHRNVEQNEIDFYSKKYAQAYRKFTERSQQ